MNLDQATLGKLSKALRIEIAENAFRKDLTQSELAAQQESWRRSANTRSKEGAPISSRVKLWGKFSHKLKLVEPQMRWGASSAKAGNRWRGASPLSRPPRPSRRRSAG